MPDSVDHPQHYIGTIVSAKSLRGRKIEAEIECIDLIEALELPSHLANVLKYLWRHKEKGGLEDLKKANWYLARYIKREERKNAKDRNRNRPM